jgi:peptide/nickel transport system substrate-binding protein
MKRRFRPWALPALLLCTGALAAPPSPTEIRIAESFDTPTSMPGHRSRNTLTDGIMLHVVESLVALKSDLGVGPMLADSWTISPDGKTYRFKLRRGVRFHNGAPVTSAEVIWSLNRIMDPRAESYCRNQYDGSKGAKVVAARADAPDAVTIELDRPNALFLQQLANIQCPLAVLHPDSVDAAGKWLRPIGTGPYLFGQWRRGQFVQLLAWSGYQPRPEPPDGLAGAKRALANLRFVVIPDAASQKAAFMSGQVDLITAQSDSPPPKAPLWTIHVEQNLDANALLMQSRDPLLSKPAMRRAVALSLDLPTLVAALTNKTTTYNPSLVPLGTANYSPVHARGYTQDLARVKALLEEAGYKGEVVTIQTNKRFPDLYRIAVVAQSMLRRAGIHAVVEVLEWATQVSNYREGKFQIMAFTYSSRLDPAVMYGDVLGDKSRTPTSQWTDPEASAILARIAGVSDPAQRKAAFEQIHQRMIAATPMIEIYNTPALVAVSKRLSGFVPWSLHRPRLFNVSKR